MRQRAGTTRGARRLFRRSVDETRAWPGGLEAAGGVKTLLVWAHKEWTIGNVALVSFATVAEEARHVTR